MLRFFATILTTLIYTNHSFMTKNIQPPGFKRGEMGLIYKDDIVGIGKRPSHGDELEVHYRGWYYSPNSTEGIKFDDSRDRDPKKGLIFDYGISPIIQGWNLGIKTMNQGGVRSIIIPPYLGYGNKTVHATGRPSIPGNSELVFELELLAVKNNPLKKLQNRLSNFLFPRV